jgi:AbrB family looped-hinge helix DNA binding protein
MSKVTSKLQVTLPKVLAEQLGIKPGDDLEWEVAGEVIRVMPAAKKNRSTSKDSRSLRLRVFDHATRRQKQREKSLAPELLRSAKAGRGWIREQLYTRGGAGRH